jgi:hypothetical protein
MEPSDTLLKLVLRNVRRLVATAKQQTSNLLTPTYREPVRTDVSISNID